MPFADYTTPDFVKEVNDFGIIIIALAALVGLVLSVAKVATYLDRRKDDRFAKRVSELMDPKLAKLYEFVGSRTTPIQPGENGGESLSDVNAKMDRHINDWDTRFAAVEAKMGIKDRRDPDAQATPDLD
jgi:hypothetical protein